MLRPPRTRSSLPPRCLRVHALIGAGDSPDPPGAGGEVVAISRAATAPLGSREGLSGLMRQPATGAFSGGGTRVLAAGEGIPTRRWGRPFARNGGSHELGNGGAHARVHARLRTRDVVTGPQGPRSLIRMTAAERQRYVNWWVKHSGLTPRQLRQIATGIWTDRVLDDVTQGVRPLEADGRSGCRAGGVDHPGRSE